MSCSRPRPHDLRVDTVTRSRTALLVLCGVMFLDALDVSMTGITLPSIQRDLALPPGQLQWVVSAYVVGYGGLLLLGGRAADRLGRRRVLLTALVGFVIASAAGGLADDGGQLVVARFVKGVSAAFTAPACLSIITTTFPEGPARHRALGVFATVTASGYSLGLVAGGLVTGVGWRWTFLLPAAIAAVLVGGAARSVPVDLAGPARRGYDVPGAVLVTAAMLLLVHLVAAAPTARLEPVRLAGEAVVVVLLVAGFVAVERRSRHPLLPLEVVRPGPRLRANIAAMAFFGSYLAFQFVGTLYLQSLLGWSPAATAFAFLPAGLIVMVGSGRAASLVGRFGTPRLVAVAFGLHVTGYLLFLRLGAEPAYPTLLLPTVLLLGAGFALGIPAINVQATDHVPAGHEGVAAGLLNASSQLGGAIGLAAAGAAIAAVKAPVGVAGYRAGVAVALAISLLGLAVSATGRPSRTSRPPARRTERLDHDPLVRR
jgi:MFS family permease